MGHSHFRKGPTKVLFFGLSQPFRDAIKLFSKEFLKGYRMSYVFFFFAPFLGIFLMFVLWCVYRGLWGVYGSLFALLYVFCFLSLGVYFLLACG